MFLYGNFRDRVILTTLFQTEELVMPYLSALANFRDNVRQESIAAKAKGESPAVPVLKECDRLRDSVLPELGVRLEDKEGEATVIKLVDPEELAREKKLKAEVEERRKEEKERKRREAEERKAAAEAQKRISPQEMFQVGEFQGKFSKYNEQGLPTHDASGEEVAKAKLKKLQKLYDSQKKKYDEYLKSQSEQ